MSDVDAIAEHIRKIGEKMVADYQPAPDVVLDKKQGIIPRCLIFEKEGRNPHGQGSVVVGVNPGKSGVEEQQFYCARGCSYEGVLAWHFEDSEDPHARKRGKHHPYYRSLTGLLDAAGLDGPILWTELAKCESKQGTVPFDRNDWEGHQLLPLPGTRKDTGLLATYRSGATSIRDSRLSVL
jgi:hypothetical protein